MLSLAGAMVVGGRVYVFMPLWYTASTSLLLSERPDMIAVLSETAESTGRTPSLSNIVGGLPVELKRVEAILNSRRIATRLARKYGLSTGPGFDADQALATLSGMTKIKLLADVGVTIQVTCCGPSRLQSWLGQCSGLPHEQAKRLCADLANEYAAALDEYVTEMSVAEARATREFVEKREQEVAAELAEIEDRLQALQTTYALIDPEHKAGELVELTKSAAQSYASATAEAEALSRSLRTARAQLAQEDATRIALEVTARNPVITGLEQKLAELRVELATELESGKVASHPAVLQIQAAIDSTEQQLEELVEEVRQQTTRQASPLYDAIMSKVVELEIALAGTRATKAVCATQLAQAKKQTAALPPVVREYVTLSRERQIQSELQGNLASRRELAALEEQRESSARLQVLDRASAPRKKSGPSSVRSAKLAFAVLVIMLGLVVAHRRGLLVPRLLE